VDAANSFAADRSSPDRAAWEAIVAAHLAEPEVSQNYRQLAERMLANAPPGVPQNLLLTSVGCPADETLGRLAWMLAEMCGPVLMVDANRAHAPLTIQLQRSGAPGLEELLRGERASVLPTAREKLCFLPTGNRATDAGGETLTALGSHLAKWRSEYPIVLIDGGDALSESACSLARLCDATYLLVGLGTATTEAAREATRRFRATGGRLLGCIAVESAGFQ
jgi:Mrp family chromosome partitioning ATPase